MQLNVSVKSLGNIKLTDKEYIGAGGEASVYKVGDTAFKIYHDSKKMLPIGKIHELQKLTSPNVLKPIDIIRSHNIDIGYTMKFVSDTHPICKLFTKTFRDRNCLSPKDMIGIVKIIQDTVEHIHREECLIVDLNELNLLANSKFNDVFFIDADSYQTKSYKATAIMDSIRDRLVKNNHFTEMSDWFSFAVIAFQLYIGIHPYKGKCDGYKPNEWSKRMEDGVSVLDKRVTLPPTCYDFSVIPKGHMNWFHDIFVNNNRSVPPPPDQLIVVVPVQKLKVITSTGDFEVKEIWSLSEPILLNYYYTGCEFSVTSNYIFQDKNIWRKIDSNHSKIGLCDSGDNLFPTICTLDDDKLTFIDSKNNHLGVIQCKDFMMRNGCIYAVSSGNLVECSIDKIGDKSIFKTRKACNISELSSMVFDGVVFQNLLGKIYITLPFTKGSCCFKPIKELDNYRILDAKSEENICVVLAEKGSKYYRFIIVFDSKFNSYNIRIDNDVDYQSVNFTVKPNGVCVMTDGDDAVIFKDDKVKRITNSPFDSTNKLFNRNGDIFFLDEKKIYSVKTK